MLWKIVILFYILATVDCCMLIKSGPMNCSDTKRLLDYHNGIRNHVALRLTKLPPAMNMFALEWKEALAKIAQDYANQCSYGYDNERPKNSGENIATSESSTKMMADVIEMAKTWYSQLSHFSWEKIPDLTSNSSTGHFMQMVWGDSKYLGCGVSFFGLKDANSKYNYKTLLVCNYEPAGVIWKKEPYSQYHGKRCHNNMIHLRYKGLCGIIG